MNTAFEIEQYGKLPPMLEQYIEYKNEYPDCLIFCQVGDFYELFFEDAKVVAKTLNLTLTSRDKNSENPVPMCGVPISVIDGYIDRLVDLGFSVAIVSQAELASEAKGMVKRKLERIITPAVRLLGSDKAESCVAASIYFDNEKNMSIAFLDVQNATLFYRENISLESLKSELSRVSPKEIIVLQNLGGKRIDRRTLWFRDIERSFKDAIIKIKPETYSSLDLNPLRKFSELQGYASLSNATKKAVRILINYIDEITIEKTLAISEVSKCNYDNIMSVDASARQNLELITNIKDGSKKNTLFDYMDKTITQGGEKLLRTWILSPLLNVKQIKERQNVIKFFLSEVFIRSKVRNILKYICNFSKIASRLEMQIVSPRELGSLRDSLNKIPEIIFLFKETLDDIPSNLRNILDSLIVPEELKVILDNTLIEEPSNSINEGNIIKEGFSKEVDRLRDIRQGGCSWILELEAKEREASGINSLKIKFNNVLGYFIEVTKVNKDKVPDYFIQRQSTSNYERFFTPELKEREKEVLGAEAKLFALERELFANLKNTLQAYIPLLRSLSDTISLLDLYASLAELAENEALVCPNVTSDYALDIKQGMHPVLKKVLKSDFIPNSLNLSSLETLVVLTGPNMGGKSTFLRQVALIVIMAQIGSFVPAKEAAIGLVDKIFARLGASDDMEEGESTFMVEMREASNILSNATERSLVLIDEIGRGTATTDGISIAEAILEYLLLKIKCKTVFATHFHELTELAKKYKQLKNISVGSIELEGEVVFTHEIVDGAAKKSYGIHVAKLAGINKVILNRAREILTKLDAKNNLVKEAQMSFFDDSLSGTLGENLEDMRSVGDIENIKDLNVKDLFKEDLFKKDIALPDDYEELKGVAESIKNIDINSMTPIEALKFLNDLKNEII
ncbi:MAG: DNA mismatch repair protein MutS [Bdellovibrionota bacterium]